MGDGTLLLVAYAARVGVPFLISALAVDRFLPFFSRFRPFLPVVGRVAGLLLVGVGLLLALNLNAYFISLTPQWLLDACIGAGCGERVDVRTQYRGGARSPHSGVGAPHQPRPSRC